MTRLALAIVVTAAAGVGIVSHQQHKRPTSAASAPLALVEPLRASRWQERQPLPGVKPQTGMRGKARHDPAKRGTRPAPGGELLDITAYCATGHQTASGKTPRVGMAAGNRWSFGTVLRIAGYGRVVVEDRIGWGSDVDLYFGDDPDCEARASAFGRQHRLVLVVR